MQALDAVFADAAHVARLTSHVSRVTACSMEPRGALGLVDDSGRLVLHASNQSPFAMKPTLAGLFKVDPSMVRILAGDVGGSFGMKSGVYPEDVLVLWAARRLGRPVRWISERRESSSPTTTAATCTSMPSWRSTPTAASSRSGRASTSTSAAISRAARCS